MDGRHSAGGNVVVERVATDDLRRRRTHVVPSHSPIALPCFFSSASKNAYRSAYCSTQARMRSAPPCPAFCSIRRSTGPPLESPLQLGGQLPRVHRVDAVVAVGDWNSIAGYSCLASRGGTGEYARMARKSSSSSAEPYSSDPRLAADRRGGSGPCRAAALRRGRREEIRPLRERGADEQTAVRPARDREPVARRDLLLDRAPRRPPRSRRRRAASRAASPPVPRLAVLSAAAQVRHRVHSTRARATGRSTWRTRASRRR